MWPSSGVGVGSAGGTGVLTGGVGVGSGASAISRRGKMPDMIPSTTIKIKNNATMPIM